MKMIYLTIVILLSGCKITTSEEKAKAMAKIVSFCKSGSELVITGYVNTWNKGFNVTCTYKIGEKHE